MPMKNLEEFDIVSKKSLEDSIQSGLNILRNSGYMTEITRETFKNYIYGRKLSIEAVAHIFGVTTASVHKWLNGKTKRLPVSSRRKMLAFLDGRCEADINYCRRRNSLVAEESMNYDVPLDMAYLLERIRKIYEIFSHDKNLGEIFLKKMEIAMMESFKELIPPIVNQLRYVVKGDGKDGSSSDSGGK